MDQFVNKREDLVMFIANDHLDIMLITEIIPKNQVNPITQALLDIECYKSFLNFNPNNSKLGASGIRGVAIYYKESMVVNEVDFSINGCRDHAWIEIPTDKGESLLCGCIYRTQSNDIDNNGCIQSTKAITQLIRTAYQRNTNLLIAGDFNYRNIDWTNEYAPKGQQHQDFIETLQDCYLFQHVTEPTRYRDGESSNILDLILSNEEGMVNDLTYHPPIGESDHVCLRFSVFLNQYQGKYVTPVRNIFRTNYEAVREEMQQQSWYEKLNFTFENDYDTFFDILHSTLENHSPLSTPPIKKKNMYMTNEAFD